jgi:hypothetical protein
VLTNKGFQQGKDFFHLTLRVYPHPEWALGLKTILASLTEVKKFGILWTNFGALPLFIFSYGIPQYRHYRPR